MAADLKRREFTKPQKAEMLRRASDEKGRVWCEGCGLNVTGKRVEFDHTIPEAMILDKTRKLTAADGKLLGYDCCHRGPDGKTAQDVADIAEAKRREAQRGGFDKSRPYAGKLKGQGFLKGGRQRRATEELSKPLPPRRNPFTGKTA